MPSVSEQLLCNQLPSQECDQKLRPFESKKPDFGTAIGGISRATPVSTEMTSSIPGKEVASSFVDTLLGKLDIDRSGDLSKTELVSGSENPQLSREEREFAKLSADNYDILRLPGGPELSWKSMFGTIGPEMFYKQALDRKSLELAVRLNSDDVSKELKTNYLSSVNLPMKTLMGAGMSAYIAGTFQFLPVLFPNVRQGRTAVMAIAGGGLVGFGIEKTFENRAENAFDKDVAPQVVKMQNDLRRLQPLSK